jgi:hypothetical protein
LAARALGALAAAPRSTDQGVPPRVGDGCYPRDRGFPPLPEDPGGCPRSGAPAHGLRFGSLRRVGRAPGACCRGRARAARPRTVEEHLCNSTGIVRARSGACPGLAHRSAPHGGTRRLPLSGANSPGARGRLGREDRAPSRPRAGPRGARQTAPHEGASRRRAGDRPRRPRRPRAGGPAGRARAVQGLIHDVRSLPDRRGSFPIRARPGQARGL